MTCRTTTFVFLALSLFNVSCFTSAGREIREDKYLSSFTLDGDYLYFGAGDQVYRLNLSSRSVEGLLTTNRVLVEQPLIADGVLYFGGRKHVNSQGVYGDQDSFYALDLKSGNTVWKFPLGQGGYGSSGTYPVIAGDRLLVCARQHLYCLNRRTGELLWKVDNWFGDDSDGTTLPYVYNGAVFFKIAEKYFTNSDVNDGHWAVVALDSGKRIDLLPVAEKPGSYNDTRGQGAGALLDGIVYGATRYSTFPLSRFGALDLERKKLLWEVEGVGSRARPGLNGRYVYVNKGGAIEALDRKTGDVKWSISPGDVGQIDLYRNDTARESDFEKRWFYRFAATDEVIIVQGPAGIAGLNADNGKLLWFAKNSFSLRSVDPVIVGQQILFGDAKDCSIFALDSKTGKELWRVRISDCGYYKVLS